MADQVPPGVSMPKKRDPRLRQMQAPQQQRFFDSADYEVRKQQQHSSQQQQTHTPQPQRASNGIPRRGAADGLRPAVACSSVLGGRVPPPPPSLNE
ncbi:hypothetical protein JKF63_02562 [Porcisia hertigi]|uniref:Uncharacterized protein n=1 Tax=Porcisia hertigi TaxID=2761500 RepID=A0A836HNB7_9TRYP|nr:hypothetical protein JKF63_02562 [Porcisia hertigi]